MSSPRILAFAGSLRRQSWNHRVVEIAAEGARSAGAEVTLIRLHDYPLPVYNADEQAGGDFPAPAAALRDMFAEHDGLLIGSPEYNSSLTAALKNTIDWVSVANDNSAPMQAFRGKVAGLVAASPGALGGLRGLNHLRSILASIGVLVVPEQHAVGKVGEYMEAYAADNNHPSTAALRGVGERVAHVAAALAQ